METFIHCEGKLISSFVEVNEYDLYYDKLRQDGGALNDRFRVYRIDFLLGQDSMKVSILPMSNTDTWSYGKDSIDMYIKRSLLPGDSFCISLWSNPDQFPMASNSAVSHSDVVFAFDSVNDSIELKIGNESESSLSVIDSTIFLGLTKQKNKYKNKRISNGNRPLQMISNGSNEFLIYINSTADTLIAQSLESGICVSRICIEDIPMGTRKAIYKYSQLPSCSKISIKNDFSFTYLQFSTSGINLPVNVYRFTPDSKLFFTVERSSILTKLRL